MYSLVIGAVLFGIGLRDHRAAPLWPLGLLLAALPLLVGITTWVNAWRPIAIVTPDGLAPHGRGTPIPRNEITRLQVLPGRRVPRCDLSRLAWGHPICFLGMAGLDELNEVGEELARRLGLREA